MDVGVGIEREVKVDDIRDVLEVNPSRDTRFFVLLPPVNTRYAWMWYILKYKYDAFLTTQI